MSVGYTCPGLNQELTHCIIHPEGPDGIICRVQGDPRPPVRNTSSQKGQAPAGATDGFEYDHISALREGRPSPSPCNDYAPDSLNPDPEGRAVCSACFYHLEDHGSREQEPAGGTKA